MTESQDNALLNCAVAEVMREFACARCYLFGSAVKEVQMAADIDVLVVCGSDEIAVAVRQELKAICVRLPVHLSVLTTLEESELDFVAAEGCVPILPDG